MARKTSSGTPRTRRHSSGAGWPLWCLLWGQPAPELCLLVLGVPELVFRPSHDRRASRLQLRAYTAHNGGFYSYVVGHGPGRELSRLVQPLAVWQAGKFQLAQAEPRALIPAALKPSRVACAPINKPCIRPMKPHNHRCNPFSRRPHQDDPKAGNDGRKHRCIDSRPEPLPSIPAPNIPNPTTSSAREGTPARSPSRHGLRRPAGGVCTSSSCSTSSAANES